MDKKCNNIFNSEETELPKELKQAVFMRIEKEKSRGVARKMFWLRAGSISSIVISIVIGVIIGKEMLSSEFVILAMLAFSDLKTVLPVWQDYAMSLLETMPTASIAVTLLPIFVCMLLLRQYGKLQQLHKGYVFKH
jgi:hypothetical protein